MRAMEEYIEDAQAAGFSRPSTLPAAARIFFVEKKNERIQHCIDYSGDVGGHYEYLVMS